MAISISLTPTYVPLTHIIHSTILQPECSEANPFMFSNPRLSPRTPVSVNVYRWRLLIHAIHMKWLLTIIVSVMRVGCKKNYYVSLYNIVYNLKNASPNHLIICGLDTITCALQIIKYSACIYYINIILLRTR